MQDTMFLGFAGRYIGAGKEIALEYTDLNQTSIHLIKYPIFKISVMSNSYVYVVVVVLSIVYNSRFWLVGRWSNHFLLLLH